MRDSKQETYKEKKYNAKQKKEIDINGRKREKE